MFRKWIVCMTVLGLALVLGCGKKDGEGPAERAGKEVDKAVEQAGKEIDKALEEAGKAADEAVKKAEEIADEAIKAGGDTGILAKIKAKLTADAVLRALRIEITVEDGVVTLKGSVASKEQSGNAAKIAKDTEGVKDVKNELDVKAD